MIDKTLKALPGLKRTAGLLAVLAGLRAGLIITQACLLAAGLAALWAGTGLAELCWGLAGFWLCFLGRAGLLYLQEAWLERYAWEQASRLQGGLLRKIFALGRPLVQREGSGSLTSLALEGVEQARSHIALALAKIAGLVLIPPLLLGSILVLDWLSALILLAALPLLVVFMLIFGQAARLKAARQYKSFQRLSNHFLDSLRGLETLKMFGRGKKHAASVFKVSESFRRASLSALKVALLSGFALDFFATLSVAVVAVGLGLRLLDGSMQLFQALAVLILAPEFFLPLRDFAADYHAGLDGKNASAAIRKILDLPEAGPGHCAISDWGEHSILSLASLTYAYPGRLALRDVSFTVRGFQKTGLVGLSGSGKTSLVNLLAGFARPSSGAIRVNGRELPHLGQEDWRRQVIYIPQDPYIFQASLRDNLAFYHPTASEEELVRVVELVGLADLLAELPRGLDTVIGAGARPISGGQAQRIALARAFLDQERRILFFDEPTAHLDIQTELELQEKMLPLMEKRLVFFATHRLHWLKRLDAVLLLEAGESVAYGTLAELARPGGRLAHLCRAWQGGRP